ncbi:MAG: GNAT family N-acetyltransferase [Leptolyngbyaceae bacterium]|nr:GNAT family N-acetyltransferase [Leptolyngbyaceae bacterium]
MHIRAATQDDIETLFEIRTSVVENHQSREEIAALGITPTSVAEMLATDCAAWIARVEGQDVGFAIANATEQTVFGLFVLPAYEGRGIGRALIEKAEQWLWSQGIDEIWLVTDQNPQLRAYGFYCHLGWIPVGLETDGPFRGEMKFIKRRA